ncbi:MAG TPA: hypothetical protein VD968_09320, partial [Pyrinomonadaceae bacterium]|nr:hypothetical protein [Pyrinomonadaceae bacterium]
MKNRRRKAEGGRQKVRGARRPRSTAAARLREAFYCLLPSAFCLLYLAAPAAAQYGRPPMSTMPKGGAPDILKEVKIEQRL